MGGGKNNSHCSLISPPSRSLSPNWEVPFQHRYVICQLFGECDSDLELEERGHVWEVCGIRDDELAIG
jgi:hypothetical protein